MAPPWLAHGAKPAARRPPCATTGFDPRQVPRWQMGVVPTPPVTITCATDGLIDRVASLASCKTKRGGLTSAP